MSEKYIKEDAEDYFQRFPSNLQVGPGHRNWVNRVKEEMMNISKYLGYLKTHQPSNQWFILTPVRDKKYNYRIWEVKLKIPPRPDIQFDMIVMLSKEYPKIYPRCFIEDSFIKYAGGNLYIESDYIHNGKRYIMLCHDHMKDLDVWSPDQSIAHFLLREIYVYWNSKINTIMKLWDQVN